MRPTGAFPAGWSTHGPNWTEKASEGPEATCLVPVREVLIGCLMA